jgi:uncharacterized repeat protein (TIGR02543 family)
VQPAVERKGYAVEGWYTKNTYAPDTRWNFATSVVMQDVTLYARWDTVYYRISYALGGGANHPANPDSFCIASPAITLHPATRAGYTFDGWRDAIGNLVASIPQGSMGDRLLAAQWTSSGGVTPPAPALYPVILVRNNGAPNDTLRVAHGDAILRPDKPNKNSYTFAGWWRDENFTTLWNFPTDRVTGSVTLYAKWISGSTTTCTVSFSTGSGSTVDPQVVAVGEKVKCPNDPQKAGYVFGGWYGSATLTASSRWDCDTPITQDATLYAQWTPNNGVLVCFNSNGGSAIPPEKVGVGGRVTKPDEPQRDHYEFGGWYRDSTLIVPWDFENDLVSNRGATLYAGWEVTLLQLDSVVVSGGHGWKVAATVDAERNFISCEIPCNDPDATLLFTFHTPDGVSSGFAGDTLRLHVEGGYSDTIAVVIRSFKRKEQSYTLSVERKLAFEKVVHTQLGARLLMVVNNPLHNGGFYFREALWRIGGELDMGCRQLYYVSRDGFPITDSVKVTLKDIFGRMLHVCPRALSAVPAAPAAVRPSVYPNPVPAAGTIRLKDDLLAAIADGRYSTFRLLSAAGASIRSAPAADLAEGLAMPAIPDAYFLILEGAAGKATITVTVSGK